MPAIHDAHATMFGRARYGELYERWAGRLAGRLLPRLFHNLPERLLPQGRPRRAASCSPWRPVRGRWLVALANYPTEPVIYIR